MRKLKEILFACVLFCICTNSMAVSSDIVTIERQGDSIIVSFDLPAYTMADTSLYDLYGINEQFTYIDIDDDFGVVYDVGYPQLPQLSINLHLPVDSVQCTVTMIDSTIEKEFLYHKVLPIQPDLNDTILFRMDTTYYASDGNTRKSFYNLSNPYQVFGETGVCLSIFPFRYHPNQDSLTVLTHVSFVITYNGIGQSETRTAMESTGLTDETASFLSALFDNELTSTKSTYIPIFNRYLIITAPEFLNWIGYFANYKRNLGYDVTVVTTDETGTSKVMLLNYILTKAADFQTRPFYILLVGNYTRIPAFGDTTPGLDFNDNPLSDLYYTLFNENDYLPDALIGRFPAESDYELLNMCNKTIYMETNLSHVAKKAKLAAGNDPYNSYMQMKFNQCMEHISDRGFNRQGYSCQKLYQPLFFDWINAVNDNPTFCVYTGHGGETSYNYIAEENLRSLTNNIYPFMFAWACLTGNFANSSNIGAGWIKSNHGAVCFYGSSTVSYLLQNSALSQKTLVDAFNLLPTSSIGSVLTLGKRYYGTRFFSWLLSNLTQVHLKAYNLLGDPSLKIGWNSCMYDLLFQHPEIFYNGQKIEYQVANDMSNDTTFNVLSGADVTLSFGHELMLNYGFKVNLGASFSAQINPCIGSETRSSKENYVSENKTTSSPIPLSVKDIKDSISVIVYPNPVHDALNIQYELQTPASISITLQNISGVTQKVLLKECIQSVGLYNKTFYISDLPHGMYFLLYQN